MHSVRRLLLMSLIGVIGVVSLGTAWVSHRAALQEAGELFDAKLAHSARVLRALVDESFGETDMAARREPLVIDVWQGQREGHGDDLITADGHAYETKLLFQVRAGDGHLLLRSESAPQQALAPLVAGFRSVELDGRVWRVFSLQSPRGLWYQSAEDDAIRDEIAREVASGSLLPLLFGLALTALLVWGIVSWGCRPLSTLASALAQRAPDQLEPLAVGALPQELQPLAAAMNDLIARLAHALERERRLSTDAAHELRTPIAAVRVHAENALAAADEATRTHALEAVRRGAQRLERLVEQLLALGRLEPGARMSTRERIDLGALVTQQVTTLVEAGAGRSVDLEIRGAEAGVSLVAEPVAIGALVRNLVDNALRYTPAGGQVRVSVEMREGHAALRVEDSGPGIPSEARERVFDRFHRELGTGGSGSGLGLSIVQRAAQLHQARITLDRSAALGGLQVDVEFGA